MIINYIPDILVILALHQINTHHMAYQTTHKTFIVFAPDMVPQRAIICRHENQSGSTAYGRIAFGKDALLLSMEFHTPCPILGAIFNFLSEKEIMRILDDGFLILPLDLEIPIEECLEALRLMEDNCG